MVSERVTHVCMPNGHTGSTSPKSCPRVWLENSPHVRGRVENIYIPHGKNGTLPMGL
ncbi:hypothetical protein RchiOBHm_Chr5g0082331 [Rosa chinensis]|uniref:Uncharacterized protein n=1 Tax=Rosa chinensis TaxID=74649 RepID=A0A2P6QN99_ROSCH|nr:hypothetical protein RchiOBHm_Chr5g0082331 [Rosa chinensis]